MIYDLYFIQKCGQVHAKCTLIMIVNTSFSPKGCAGMFLHVVITSDVGFSEFQFVTLDAFMIT